MFKKLFAPTDMTVGSVWKSIVMFTLPMLIGNIAQQFYSTVDTIVVGQYAANNGLEVVRFVRFVMGEGLQKREENFAEEVMKQM